MFVDFIVKNRFALFGNIINQFNFRVFIDVEDFFKQ